MATIQCQGHIFENIGAVIFDKDGTLANVEDYLIRLGTMRSQFSAPQDLEMQATFLKVLGVTNNRLDPSGLMAVGSRYENEVALAAYLTAQGRPWIPALEQVQLAFQAAEAALHPKVTQTPLLLGTLQLLQQLGNAGIKIGIVSSDIHREVADFVAHYQLSEISWYRGAGPNTPPKTTPGSLQSACENMTVEPGETLVIGDSAADWALAQQGAAGFVAMAGGWQTAPNWDKIQSANIPFSHIPNLTVVECVK